MWELLGLFKKMGEVSEFFDEAGDWKDHQSSDQLSHRICALDARWLYLSLFSLSLVPLEGAMVRAFLESMIVAGPRVSPAWKLPSIRRLGTVLRGPLRGRDDDRPHEFRHDGRPGGKTTARVILENCGLGVSGSPADEVREPVVGGANSP